MERGTARSQCQAGWGTGSAPGFLGDLLDSFFSQAGPCCCFSVLQLCLTLCDPWTATRQTFLSFIMSRSLLKLISIELVMPSNHLILYHPLLLLPSIFPSIRVFSNELALCIRWPKYWSFSISPSKEYSGLISFRIDWFDLLAVQMTLKSLLLHHSSKASIFWRSAFYIVQLSHPYMSIGKITDLSIQTFLGKVRALLFNMLSRFLIAFLRRSKCLNFMPEVTICSDFGTQNNKICHCLHGFPIYFP